MLQEFIKSLFLIFIAEMGDKTQILAMAFATQYSIQKVLWGVFIGAFLNHGIAVLLGSYLSNVIPIKAIQILAGFSFIGFSLWTLRKDKEEVEGKKKNFGPVLTVAMAFFIGELGDKTQLTAITLAASANFPMMVLFGTVSGMVLTSSIGIFVGNRIGNHIPKGIIKLTASGIFLIFGIMKLYKNLPKSYINNVSIVIFFIGIAASIYFLAKPYLKNKQN